MVRSFAYEISTKMRPSLHSHKGITSTVLDQDRIKLNF